jgi:hypothetical protein
MKTQLITLFSLFALLLVSTAVLADGRPTGIRIGRAVSGGGTNVEIDVTVPGTNYYFYTFGGYSTVWLGNLAPFGFQYASDNYSVPLPWAVEWGDGYYFGHVPLFGSPGGPFTGTFSHTYLTPGSYTITVGDIVGDYPVEYYNSTFYGPNITTGNVISGQTFFICDKDCGTENEYPYYFLALAVTANATVNTGTGIPTLNLYGLLAMAFVLVGAGLLVYRRPTVA